jgi:hypothetical protein
MVAAVYLLGTLGCADITHTVSPPPSPGPGDPGMTTVSADGGAENFSSTSDIPSDWWMPRINKNSAAAKWEGNKAVGYSWVEAWSNRGLVNGAILVTNDEGTVAQQNELIHTHTNPVPYTWYGGSPFDVTVQASCGQTADFKSIVAVANVVLVNWEDFTLGSASSTRSHSASQAACPPLPGGGGGGSSGGGNPFDGSECVLWGVFINGVLSSTFWVC